jgi:hypothetical protein
VFTRTPPYAALSVAANSVKEPVNFAPIGKVTGVEPWKHPTSCAANSLAGALSGSPVWARTRRWIPLVVWRKQGIDHGQLLGPGCAHNKNEFGGRHDLNASGLKNSRRYLNHANGRPSRPNRSAPSGHQVALYLRFGPLSIIDDVAEFRN